MHIDKKVSCKYKYTFIILLQLTSFLTNLTSSTHKHGPINHGLATPFLSYIVTDWTLANVGFHPRSHHLAIVQTRPSPPMLRFVDKVLARFNWANFNSQITWRKNVVMFVLPLVRHMFFWVIIILHLRLHWELVRLK